ncbi:hypothetical protein GIV49_26700 [Pseudomonas syringae]|nr:hypothetical protein [Pseudomonas syringae]
MRWRAASIVAVVGERNGGKTTLISEIYERFLRGTFAGTCFSGSWSLSGFEMKNFQSRAESGAERPDTPRTSARDGLRFFHLAVADLENLQSRTDLLISERAGETYRDVRDIPARATEMLELQLAKAIAFVVDGERILNDRKRTEVFASARSIVRALIETGTIRPGVKLQFVTTKYDLLDGDDAVDARAALDGFENQMRTLFGEIYRVESFRTAARDPSGGLPAGTGIAPLFRSWLEPSPIVELVEPALPELTDEFDRLILRRAL